LLRPPGSRHGVTQYPVKGPALTIRGTYRLNRVVKLSPGMPVNTSMDAPIDV
jgi:hypothetical protein